VIMRRDVVITPVSRMHHERLEWLSSQPIPNILRHDSNLSKRPQRCNTDRPRQRFAERGPIPLRCPLIVWPPEPREGRHDNSPGQDPPERSAGGSPPWVKTRPTPTFLFFKFGLTRFKRVNPNLKKRKGFVWTRNPGRRSACPGLV
jgi:hypothetical protein